MSMANVTETQKKCGAFMFFFRLENECKASGLEGTKEQNE